MNDPTSNPTDDHNRAIKTGLSMLAGDWAIEFPMLKRPTEDFIHKITRDALRRIQELEGE